MKIIAVIGAGTMGNGIAHTFAQSGFTVKLIDVSEKSLDKGMATIFANLDRMVDKGTITEEDKLKTGLYLTCFCFRRKQIFWASNLRGI